MSLTAFTGVIDPGVLILNFDDKTTRIDAVSAVGQVDYPVFVRKASLAAADDESTRSVYFSAPDDMEVRVLRVLATHTAGGITVTASIAQADDLLDYTMGAVCEQSVTSINGTAQATLDLRTTTGRRIMLLRGVRYRVTVAAAGGTLDVGQATVLLRTRRRAR